MKPQFRLQTFSAALGGAALMTMGAWAVGAGVPGPEPSTLVAPATAPMSGPSGQAVTTTTTPMTAMSFRPLITATTSPPPTGGSGMS